MSGEYIRKHQSILVVAMALVVAAVIGWGVTGAQAQSQARFPLSSPVATNAKTNLLDQPDSQGALAKALPVNARGIVLGGPFNDGWYWLDFSGSRGYAQGKALVLVDGNYTPVAEGTPPATKTPLAPTRAATGTSVPPAATATAPAPTVTPTPDSVLGNYAGLWLGEMSSAGNVRVAPGVESTRLKGWPAGRRVLLYQEVKDSKGDSWYRVSETPEEPMYVHSSLVKKLEPVKFEGAKYKGRWVDVNVGQQITTAYENGKPVKVTLCSTGKGEGNLTELGVWKIYWRLPKQDMSGGSLASGDFYDLKDVPYPQYFHTSGEALHGTYWHDDFGRPRSHGCVNLSTPMSEWFYGWASIGTTVYVHN